MPSSSVTTDAAYSFGGQRQRHLQAGGGGLPPSATGNQALQGGGGGNTLGEQIAGIVKGVTAPGRENVSNIAGAVTAPGRANLDQAMAGLSQNATDSYLQGAAQSGTHAGGMQGFLGAGFDAVQGFVGNAAGAMVPMAGIAASQFDDSAIQAHRDNLNSALSQGVLGLGSAANQQFGSQLEQPTDGTSALGAAFGDPKNYGSGSDFSYLEDSAMLDSLLAPTMAAGQQSLADIAMQRAFLGDALANSKQGLQLTANQQRELLNYAMGTHGRDRGFLDRQRGLVDESGKYAGRELDLDKDQRNIERGYLPLARADIDLSDRNIEYDRTDRTNQYAADIRHLNQRHTAGGSWFAPERMAMGADLYSGLLTDGGRLDTRLAHNNLERSRVDLQGRTIDNSAGRDQLSYDRAMQEIASQYLGLDRQYANLDDSRFKTQNELSYLDPILANRMGGLDLGYRGDLLKSFQAEHKVDYEMAQALAEYYANRSNLGILPGSSALGSAAGRA